MSECFGMSEDVRLDEQIAPRFWAPGSVVKGPSVVARAALAGAVEESTPAASRCPDGCWARPLSGDVARGISPTDSTRSVVERAFVDVVPVDAPTACWCVGGSWAALLPEDAPRNFWSLVWEAPAISAVPDPAFADVVAVVAVGAICSPGGCWASPLSEVVT